MDAFSQTARLVVDLAKKHETVLVAFSGGKDSFAVLDLCARAFRNVRVASLYLVPGLEVIEQQIRYVERRWGVQVAQYQHNHLFDYLRAGVYCYPSMTKAVQRMGKITFGDILAIAKRDADAELIMVGQKRVDNMMTRTRKTGFRSGDIVYPLYQWRHQEVLAYLKMRKIPRPDSDGRISSSVDLTTPSLLWLHDKHPEDFKRLARYFPDIVGVPKRRDWFGVGNKNSKRPGVPEGAEEKIR